jgi:hypothetical protein
MIKLPTKVDGVPIEVAEVPCIFDHGAVAVARYTMSEGCICFPDREQDLCPQHAIDSQPLGKNPDFHAIKVYHPAMWTWMNGGISRSYKPDFS